MMVKVAVERSLLLLLVGGFCSPNRVSAIKCGTALTTECLGATDIRYNPDASNNVEEQGIIWKKTSGLFVGEGTLRANALEPLGPVPAVSDPSLVIASIPYYEFVNRTNVGSRRYTTSYTVVPLSPTPEKVSRNVAFATTTYEKDGTLLPFTGTVTDEVGDESPSTLLPSILRAYAVDENTAYSANEVSGIVDGVISTLRVCLDVDCNRYDESFDVYSVVDGSVRRVYATEVSYRRVETSDEWYGAILARYNESNIPLEQRLDPTVNICDLDLCLTEEEWCRTDPDCSESPYQEPPASVRGGVIAGFTIAGVVILVAILYLIHRHLLARQAQRYRTVFAKRIADTIQVRGSMRALPPDALVEEFDRIDAGVKDGKLSKEEMWEFVSSGKAGEMDRKDFDALFAAIDLDGNGNVDFLEFCAFMGKCHDEYRAARVDRGSIVARRVSAASTAFVKVSEDVEAEADA